MVKRMAFKKNKILIVKILLSGICILFLAVTFRTENRSSGWVQQTIPRQDLPIMDLRFIDSLNGYLVSTKPAVDTAFIFKTTNGGINWTTTYFDSLYLVCMDFVDKDVGYCGGATVGSGILKKTTNGGYNWFTVSSIPFILIADVEFVNKDTGWICHSSVANGGLWRTTNGGLSWQMQLDYNYAPTKIFFIDKNTGWLLSYNNFNLYKTTNSGFNWSIQYTFNSMPYDIYFSTIDTGWVIKGHIFGQHDALIRSTNGGSNWDSINAPIIGTASRLNFIDNNRGWAGSSPNKIFVSKDGYNWGRQYSPIFASIYVSFADSMIGWAGGSGLVHTTDGGGPIIYTGIKRNGNFIPSFELKQNYPNPFNSSTKILFEIFKSCTVELFIYDITGREITTLISGQEYKNGVYKINFDASKYSLSSGTYFCTIRSETLDHKEIFIDTKKMLLVK
jgi:photosystem II stability/assembly factor-like uncharacterized protein